jgi:osmotically-inducible protein OsmY
MNRIQLLVLASAVLMAAAATTAWSQTGSVPASTPGAAAMTSDAAATASGAAAPAGGRKADRALRRKVYAAIGKRKEIDAGNISVVAKSGAVTLYGTVTDAAKIGQVAEIAKGVPGVTSVTNKLTVEKPLGGM